MSMNLLKKKPDSFDHEASRICKVCSNGFKGRYCNKCGEKVTEPYERSVLNFFNNLLNAFTFLDGKFLRSLKLLITQPGQLSRNIADGQRVPYMKMVSLFFVANFFYFLFPVFDSYNSSLYSQMNWQRHSENAREMVKEKLDHEKIDLKEFQNDYENESTNLSKLLIVLLVFAFTGFLMVINYSKEKIFFDHLLFSFEFFSFLLLINSVLLPNIFRLVIRLGKVGGMDWDVLISDQFFSRITVLVLTYFLVRGQLLFYKLKWFWAVPKTIVLIFLLLQSVILYRMLLFYLTMWKI